MGPLATDLLVAPGFLAHDAASLDGRVRSRVPRGSVVEVADLAIVNGRENLAQALLLRLLTPRGALAALGHAEYGSRLHELIGRAKTGEQRALAKAFVLEAVAMERRVQPKLIEFRFELEEESIDSIAFTLSVRPVAGGDPVALGLEVAL